MQEIEKTKENKQKKQLGWKNDFYGLLRIW